MKDQVIRLFPNIKATLKFKRLATPENVQENVTWSQQKYSKLEIPDCFNQW